MRGLGAGCGLVKGDGGLLGTWGCSSVLVLVGDVWRHTSIVRGAIWLMIGVAVGLVGMGGLRPRAMSTCAAQLNRVGSCSIVSNTVRTVGLAKDNGGSPDPFERLFALCLAGKAGVCAPFVWGAVSPVIEAVMGLTGVRLDNCDGGRSFSLGISPFPLLASALSSSTSRIPPCSVCWLLASSAARCACLASRALRRVLTVVNVASR